MKIKYTFILLIVLLINNLTAKAQSWLWGEQGTGYTALVWLNVATDKTGNVYQTGDFQDSITFGHYTLTSGIETTFLVKYDSSGNVLWATQPLFGTSYEVATDDSDNAYLIGNGAVYNTFLMKYHPNGTVAWAKKPTLSYASEGYAITVDNFGHEYLTGDYAFLLKCDRNGNFIWTKLPVVPNHAVGNSLTTDIYGNVYMSGTFQDSLKLGTYKLYSNSSGAFNYGLFIAKFDSDGNVLWAQSSSSSASDSSHLVGGNYTIATDRSGAVYLTGTFLDSILFNSYKFTSQFDNYSFFIIKYSPYGNIVWGKQAYPINSSSSGGWGSYSICSDDSNHLYISGAENNPGSSSFVFGNDTLGSTNSSGDDPSFLLKLDSSGNVICGSMINGGGRAPNAVTSDSTGKFVYLGGVHVDSLELGKDILINNSGVNWDTYVGRWKPCYAEATAISQVSINKNQLSIYPNPFINNVFVKINSSASDDRENYNLKVIDELGRVIYYMPSMNYSNEIDLSNLPAAMYFISVTNDTNRTVMPIVKLTN